MRVAYGPGTGLHCLITLLGIKAPGQRAAERSGPPYAVPATMA